MSSDNDSGSEWYFYDGCVYLRGTIQDADESEGYVQLRIREGSQLCFVEATQTASEAMIESGLHDELVGKDLEFTPAVKNWGGNKHDWKLTEHSLRALDLDV
jgi:hypothetical protein